LASYFYVLFHTVDKPVKIVAVETVVFEVSDDAEFAGSDEAADGSRADAEIRCCLRSREQTRSQEWLGVLIWHIFEGNS